MKVPMVSSAQVRILSEGVIEPAPFADELPEDLRPQTRFTDDEIRRGLPSPGPFGINDCRWIDRLRGALCHN
jgi:NADH dehydrogenase